jgi:hypothetical protein
MLALPSKKSIFIVALLEFLPPRLIGFFLSYAPFNRLKNTRRVNSMIRAVAKELVDEKAKALIAGKGKRDIMSLLGALQHFISRADLIGVVFSQGQCLSQSALESQ